jgi:uncharacterized membrane protein YuzA (DUF378 family)
MYRVIPFFLLLIGAVNWGAIGAFNFNLVAYLNDHTFNSEVAERFFYIILGIVAIYFLFRQSYYLPFLGETVLPPSAFTLYKQPDANRSLTIAVDKNASKVIYWAARPEGVHGAVLDPKSAYGDFSNYGIVAVKDGQVTLEYKYPQAYQVNSVLSLPHHVHYRLIYDTGFLSSIKTIFLK